MGLIAFPFPLAGKIFRSEMPFSRYDPTGKLLDDYQQAEISLVVLLAEEEEIQRVAGRDLKAIYAHHGIEVLHLPIRDYEAPDADQLAQALEKILEWVRMGRNLVIHCYAGMGRTGLVAACLAKRVLNLSGEEAVRWVRKTIPGAIESIEQLAFIQDC